MAIVLENVDMMTSSITKVMAEVTSKHHIPQFKQMQLLTHLRLARNFSSFQHRLKCVMARLQAISVLGEHRGFLVAPVEGNDEGSIPDKHCDDVRKRTFIISLGEWMRKRKE